MTERSVDPKATVPAVRQGKLHLLDYEKFVFPFWSDKENFQAQTLTASILNHYPEYSLPKGMVVQENPEGGKYYDRENDKTPKGVPLLQVKPSRKMESLAHELGHDVLYQLMPEINGSEILTRTFKELHADLNALHFTDIEPDRRDLNRDPDKDLSVYSGIEDLLDPETWKVQLENVDMMLCNVEKNNWDDVEFYAKRFANDAPATRELYDLKEAGSEEVDAYKNKLVDAELDLDHMLYENLLQEEGAPLASIAEDKHRAWGMAQVLANSDVAPVRLPVQEALNSRAQVNSYLAQAVDRMDDCNLNDVTKRPEEVLEEALQLQLEEARAHVSDMLEASRQNDMTPQFLLNQLADTKYGKKYDTSIDYPHNIGGIMAEEQYLKGTQPEEVLQNPAEYMRRGADRIKSHMADNL